MKLIFFGVLFEIYNREKKYALYQGSLKGLESKKKVHQSCYWYEAEREVPSTNTAERWNCEPSPSLSCASMVCVVFPGGYKWGWPWSWYFCAESSFQAVFTAPFISISQVTSVGSTYRIHSSMPANAKPKRKQKEKKSEKPEKEDWKWE